MKRLTTIVLLSTLCACGSGSGSGDGGETPEPVEVFQFATSETVEFVIEVENGGAPVPAASVTVTEHVAGVDDEDSEANTAETFFQAGTAADGSCTVRLRVPADVEKLDVVVQAPGLTGAYTVEALRTMAGPFAPSSRQGFGIDELAGTVVVSLTAE